MFRKCLYAHYGGKNDKKDNGYEIDQENSSYRNKRAGKKSTYINELLSCSSIGKKLFSRHSAIRNDYLYCLGFRERNETILFLPKSNNTYTVEVKVETIS